MESPLRRRPRRIDSMRNRSAPVVAVRGWALSTRRGPDDNAGCGCLIPSDMGLYPTRCWQLIDGASATYTH